MQKPFNFKLLVPPRAHLNQVSAVKPQETGLFEENSVLFPSNQSYNKCTDIETRLPFPSKMVLPTKTSRTEGMKKAAVMPMEKEETSLRSSQLYSRLLDEAEKIKLWKFKMDSEISQKDRKLQENRKTIETQRKAIQELQFANESLSMKLEDQLNENEDLRNKSNATRNLCNILKDTFERSAEKMNLFEAEREETHDLFIQNSENIQRMVAAFEGLRKQSEADQQDMLKLRECLTQFEDLKVNLESECHVKEKQVAMLQEKLQEKENNLKDVLLKLKEAQQSCSIIEESERKHQKLLQSVTQDRDALEENLRVTEQLKREIEQTQRDLTYKLEQSKENHEKALQTKDSELQELNNMKEQQSKQLSEMQLTVNSLQFSLTSEIQRTQDLETKISSLVNELSDKNTELEVIKGQKEDNNKQIQTLRNELDEKSNSLLSVKEELKTMEVQVFQLIASVEEKKNEASDLKDEMESVTTENNNMKEALSKARLDNEELQEVVALKEAKLKEVEEQLSGALESSCKSSQEVERLENDIKQQKEKYEELMLKFNDLQMQKDTIQQQVDSGALEKKVLQSHLKKSNANAEREKTEIERLEREKQQLQEKVDMLSAKIAGQDEESKNVQQQLKESGKSTKRELLIKDKQIKALESKLTNTKTKLETKTVAHEECLKEIIKLKEDSESIKKHHKEELQKLSSDLEDKSTSEAQLNLEVQKLKQTAMEALKSKDDTEIKCQQKISNMVALMERHKHEYDKMVEEKDAELNEKRMREAEVSASKASLELELSHLQVENDELRQQVEKLKGEEMALRTPVSSLEKDTLQQVTEIKPKKGRNKISKTQKADTTKKHVYELLYEDEYVPASRNASYIPAGTVNEDLHTPLWSKTTKTTPQIKSFRIRTPPTPEIKGSWKKDILKLDPKSDNSDSNDILSFSPRPVKSKRPMQPKEADTGSLDLFKKVQSSFPCKSPGTVLKLAAIKRMRDAGWTTVSNSDKKKKKVTDKIFA
ncbi:Synaptonemal complex protein 1 [Labeo rohita]|uniref:Synaptonemal complex protein 1 n=1 Tax=Labeo rohita TaxID=84645 RepID=A0ABQ8MLY0_LABRO|nr:synaptonemal complex protein 1 isoform X1 [Labeo rohita]XP_050967919.1 synaptonemal complex protein 1 isoform X1 [Labeo rohita]KAI2663834.1 Synaptonemal complex protein 1 [Labeo rohita]